MKIEIEIPDEDIKKLEETKGFIEIFPPDFDFRGWLKYLFEMSSKVALKKVYESYLLKSSGVADNVDVLVLVTEENIKMGIESLKKFMEKADKETKE